MNTEQRQRLTEIETKVSRDPRSYPADLHFLLSIVKGQEAENERLLKLYNSAWLWVQQRVTHPHSGMPPAAMTLMEMLPLLPTTMRSLCVEKVREVCKKGVVTVQELVKELESLSLQEQKS